MADMEAVIYARVSSDRGRKARSVEEQVAESRAECARRNWIVVEVITDNDIGASEQTIKKNRPGYKALKAALKGVGVLVAWESSRVTRTPWELEELMPLCADAGVLLCYSGSIYDPSKPSDKLMLRVTGATNAHETDLISERVQRAVRHRVAEGRPHARLPYGYKREFDPETGVTKGWVPDPEAAPVVREAVRRILNGETLYSVMKDFNDRGIPTPSKSQKWQSARIRDMVAYPAHAGLRTHKGETVGKGTWEPLITEDEHMRILAIVKDPARLTHHGSEPVHLLSGIIECGRCGNKMRFSRPKKYRNGRYVCQDCYLGRRTDKVDELVTETMVSFLEDPRTVAMLSEADDSASAEALQEARAAQQRLDALRTEYIDGKVSAGSFAAIEEQLLVKIGAAENRAKETSSSPLIASLTGPDARTVWDSLDVMTRRAAITTALKVTVLEQPPMGRKFDPAYIGLEWRV